MKPYISYSPREAELTNGRISIYYGEKETDPLSNDYCFVVRKDGREIFRRTNTQLLDIANGEGLKDILIAGMISFITR